MSQWGEKKKDRLKHKEWPGTNNMRETIFVIATSTLHYNKTKSEALLNSYGPKRIVKIT